MKLIPMQDFVLERRLFITNNDISESDLLAQIFLYAKFLKQPLKIEMFTPCNEDGKLLKEPEWWYRYQNGASPFMNMDEIRQCQEYKKALERVLFTGFEVESLEVYLIWIYIKGFNSDKGDFIIQYSKKSKSFWYSFYKFKTVEDLVKYKLEITSNVIKM